MFYIVFDKRGRTLGSGQWFDKGTYRVAIAAARQFNGRAHEVFVSRDLHIAQLKGITTAFLLAQRAEGVVV